MRILAIDPSVNFIGWCIFDTNFLNIRKQWKWGTHICEGNNYQMKLVDLMQTLDDIVDFATIDHLVTEWPTFFSSEKGHIAAHQSYTIDLAGVCAFIAGWMGLDHRHWHIMTATTWKGSVPKAVTSNKFYRVFGKNTKLHTSEHAIDATMMLHYWLRASYGRNAFQLAGEDFPESPLLRL